MKLAVILAVGEYAQSVGKLPACEADGKVMNAVFSTESRFDSVLNIDGNKPSSHVKRQLTEFISAQSKSEVDEIVFYFSGHGEFVDDEFHYVLSDYDPKRRKQTTLENTELDNLLKALNPKLTVKFIDACHAGVTYIKDPDLFRTYLKGTQGRFAKCYFLFSSQQDQPSYQDASMSFFTRSIAESITKHPNSELRYKDVIDYVSDAFSGDGKQTPFFVTQADFTEIFCTVSDTLRETIERASNSKSIVVSPKTAAAELSLVDLVSQDAQRYCDEQTANSALLSLRESLVLNGEEIEKLYEVRVNEGADFAELPSPIAIGTWLDKNPNNFFAHPYREDFEYKDRVLKDRHLTLFSSFQQFGDDDYVTVTRTESRIRGYRPSVDMPFLYLEMHFVPRFPNLTMYKCFIVPVVSRTELRLFYCKLAYREAGWSKTQRDGEIKWATTCASIADKSNVSATISAIVREVRESILTQIRSRFIPKVEDPAEKSAQKAKPKQGDAPKPRDKVASPAAVK